MTDLKENNIWHGLSLNTIYNMDCIEGMKMIPDWSIDSIITDPPYEIWFMGKWWDDTGIANNVDMWKECLRVLKPWWHLLSFAATRTYHRMACAIDDAGFEIRDMIEWVYGSGFPKSLNIAKSIESKLKTGSCAKNNFHQLEGERRDGRIGMYDTVEEHGFRKVNPDQLGAFDLEATTQEAKQWEGWGTALKPAHEPICMARKPLAEKTVAENVLKYGTGGINIDESRVGTDGGGGNGLGSHFDRLGDTKPLVKHSEDRTDTQGRFPANLIHDNSEEVRECFPESKSTQNKISDNRQNEGNSMFIDGVHNPENSYTDSGNASRFFKSIIYQAKASKSERWTNNNHPTVKPIALMEYLIKMVTKEWWTVLDPFVWSWTTLVAAKKNWYNYIWFELDNHYVDIANKRIQDKLSEK